MDRQAYTRGKRYDSVDHDPDNRWQGHDHIKTTVPEDDVLEQWALTKEALWHAQQGLDSLLSQVEQALVASTQLIQQNLDPLTIADDRFCADSLYYLVQLKQRATEYRAYLKGEQDALNHAWSSRIATPIESFMNRPPEAKTAEDL